MKTIYLILIACAFCTQAHARGKGNGGIDVITAKGEHIPIETYIDDHSRPVQSVCDFPEVEKDIGETKTWRQLLNKTAQALYAKIPSLGERALEALKEAEFYMLDLDEGAQLAYTDDDGNIVETLKANGAVHIPDSKEIYIRSDHWRNYWQKPQLSETGERRYRRMLTRVWHEALIPYYAVDKAGTFNLGRMVVEILRLADIYPVEGGHQKNRFQDKNDDLLISDIQKAGLFKNVPQNELLAKSFAYKSLGRITEAFAPSFRSLSTVVLPYANSTLENPIMPDGSGTKVVMGTVRITDDIRKEAKEFTEQLAKFDPGSNRLRIGNLKSTEEQFVFNFSSQDLLQHKEGILKQLNFLIEAKSYYLYGKDEDGAEIIFKNTPRDKIPLMDMMHFIRETPELCKQ